ncbi:hypothetical protein NMY22_g9644 [Coprinellus aureogranulatus]|nr:hypothetical protein NMY22_g9644 [Coprinellus aureogranulatus]
MDSSCQGMHLAEWEKLSIESNEAKVHHGLACIILSLEGNPSIQVPHFHQPFYCGTWDAVAPRIHPRSGPLTHESNIRTLHQGAAYTSQTTRTIMDYFIQGCLVVTGSQEMSYENALKCIGLANRPCIIQNQSLPGSPLLIGTVQSLLDDYSARRTVGRPRLLLHMTQSPQPMDPSTVQLSYARHIWERTNGNSFFHRIPYPETDFNFWNTLSPHAFRPWSVCRSGAVAEINVVAGELVVLIVTPKAQLDPELQTGFKKKILRDPLFHQVHALKLIIDSGLLPEDHIIEAITLRPRNKLFLSPGRIVSFYMPVHTSWSTSLFYHWAHMEETLWAFVQCIIAPSPYEQETWFQFTHEMLIWMMHHLHCCFILDRLTNDDDPSLLFLAHSCHWRSLAAFLCLVTLLNVTAHETYTFAQVSEYLLYDISNIPPDARLMMMYGRGLAIHTAQMLVGSKDHTCSFNSDVYLPMLARTICHARARFIELETNDPQCSESTTRQRFLNQLANLERCVPRLGKFVENAQQDINTSEHGYDLARGGYVIKEDATRERKCDSLIKVTQTVHTELHDKDYLVLGMTLLDQNYLNRPPDNDINTQGIVKEEEQGVEIPSSGPMHQGLDANQHGSEPARATELVPDDESRLPQDIQRVDPEKDLDVIMEPAQDEEDKNDVDMTYIEGSTPDSGSEREESFEF